MTRYSIEPIKKTKHVKGYGFLSFLRKYRKQLLNTGLDAVKIASKEVVHKKHSRQLKMQKQSQTTIEL